MPARQPHVPGPSLKPERILPERIAVADRATSHAVGGTRFVISCEHGGNRIPAAYRPLFAGHEAILQSHRGHDPGALILARELAAVLHAPLVATVTSRLLIDHNRSPGHPALYSEFMRAAPRPLREAAYADYYRPYRERVEQCIKEALQHGASVIHISSHSFTPILDGRLRNADVGFLYDPRRADEQALCLRWISALHSRAPQLKLRRNYPYRGSSDGFCTWLRRQYPVGYIGIEIEMNQRQLAAGLPAWQQLCTDIAGALRQALS